MGRGILRGYGTATKPIEAFSSAPMIPWWCGFGWEDSSLAYQFPGLMRIFPHPGLFCPEK
jgi:hypothetical protein